MTTTKSLTPSEFPITDEAHITEVATERLKSSVSTAFNLIETHSLEPIPELTNRITFDQMKEVFEEINQLIELTNPTVTINEEWVSLVYDRVDKLGAWRMDVNATEFDGTNGKVSVRLFRFTDTSDDSAIEDRDVSIDVAITNGTISYAQVDTFIKPTGKFEHDNPTGFYRYVPPRADQLVAPKV